MKWFKREKLKEEIPEEDELTQNEEIKLDVEPFKIEQTDNIQHIDDLDSLDNEIESKKHHLESITKKLTNVKQEYDLAVSNLIQVKKDLIQKNKDLRSLNSIQTTNITKAATPNQLKESKEIEEKIKKEKEAYEEIQSQIKKSKVEFDAIINEQHKSESKLEELKMLVEKSEKELGNIELNRQKIFKEIQIGQEMSKTKDKKFDGKNESKHVIEAASAAISSMKSKLKMAETELLTLKQLLEKERKEHLETKRRLESSKK